MSPSRETGTSTYTRFSFEIGSARGSGSAVPTGEASGAGAGAASGTGAGAGPGAGPEIARPTAIATTASVLRRSIW
mgnify:CR=1 FL=1